jgi:signal transduction histidine kinase
MLDTPVRVEGVVLGVLCQEEVGQSRKWTDAERQFLQELACLASRQLGNVCAESFAPGDAAERSQSSAMKQFAAGVGHDFRNLLTIIHGHASLIARMSHLDPRIRSATEKILEAAHRGEELSQELMQCGLADARPTRIIVAQEILNAVIELLRRQIPSSIDIHTDLHPQTSRVFMDPVQLERILINLLTNARDAMPAGGRITITLREEQLEEAENRTYVKITVKDTGCGMPPEILSRIFEPYYSTKPEGRGTGLGMVIVKQILERVGGMIKVRSTEGEGTAFHLYLPRVAAGD